MSWLKEKIFGKKIGQHKTSLGLSLDSDEGDRGLAQSSTLFCKGQLKNFLDRKESIKVAMLGWERVFEVRLTSFRENTYSTDCQYQLLVRSTRSEGDTTSSRICTNMHPRTTPFTTTSTSRVGSSKPDKAIPLITGFADQQLVESRLKCFSQMLECLVGGLGKMTDTRFLEWLELDKNLFASLSPVTLPCKRKLIRSFMDSSSIDQSIFSEETKKLKELLFQLTSGVDSSSCLKDIEEYIFSPANFKKFKPDEVSKSKI
jgi:hypothetical protein